jgi:hypothetical protein
MMAARLPAVGAAATAPFVNGKIHDPRREEYALAQINSSTERCEISKINFVYKTKLAGNRLSTPFL